MIEELLSKGYGVEDIALERGLPIEAVRDIVAELREEGRLAELIRKGRAQSPPKKKRKDNRPQREQWAEIKKS